MTPVALHRPIAYQEYPVPYHFTVTLPHTYRNKNPSTAREYDNPSFLIPLNLYTEISN